MKLNRLRLILLGHQWNLILFVLLLLLRIKSSFIVMKYKKHFPLVIYLNFFMLLILIYLFKIPSLIFEYCTIYLDDVLIESIIFILHLTMIYAFIKPRDSLKFVAIILLEIIFDCLLIEVFKKYLFKAYLLLKF